MVETIPSDSQASILDFYELEERPVVINRVSEEGWIWCDGSWVGDHSLVQLSYIKGLRLSEEAFVRRFSHAALALLDDQINF